MPSLGKPLTKFFRQFILKPAHAHCDIPCGIYDPHLAQIAALTVVRMNQLIEALDETAGVAAYSAALSRYVAVKEEHAELCKKELRILWGDYFKPDHLEKLPDLHERFWESMRLASTARQKNDLEGAQKLLEAVQSIAEAFWKTKGSETKRRPSGQGPVGGELVYPV